MSPRSFPEHRFRAWQFRYRSTWLDGWPVIRCGHGTKHARCFQWERAANRREELAAKPVAGHSAQGLFGECRYVWGVVGMGGVNVGGEKAHSRTARVVGALSLPEKKGKGEQQNVRALGR